MEEKKKKKQEEKTKKDIAQKKVKVKSVHMLSNMHINEAPDNFGVTQQSLGWNYVVTQQWVFKPSVCSCQYFWLIC